MRMLPLNDADRLSMLEDIGVSDVDDLFCDIPDKLLLSDLVDLPLAKSEMAVEREMVALARKNMTAGSGPFFLGAGSYRHHVPASVDHLIQRSEFLTSYTPYQPEITQGTLQALFEFQTQVATLTGMDVANASMYDGSTATVEAVLMACRVARRQKAILSGGLHPHYRFTTETTAKLSDISIHSLTANPQGGVEDLLGAIDAETACVVVQVPDFFGNLNSFEEIVAKAHHHKALVIAVVTEAISFGLLPSPGSQGVDIVVAEGQSIGNGLNFGGPYVGLFATREKYLRQMPGRLCGETVDADGRRGFVLTLSTREQHIRRERATSNICTNSGLCALAFSIHMTLLGGSGLKRLARLNHQQAVLLADKLSNVDGVKVINDSFFNEFTINLGRSADKIVHDLAEKNILAGVPVRRLLPEEDAFDHLLLVTVTELTTNEDIEAFVSALKEELKG